MCLKKLNLEKDFLHFVFGNACLIVLYFEIYTSNFSFIKLIDYNKYILYGTTSVDYGRHWV